MTEIDMQEELTWLHRRSVEGAASVRGFNNTSCDSEFQRDRARIIHSASFRSLQSKTQVLGLGESDFYRTRLTHSLEVAQIGSGICEWLRNGQAQSDSTAWIPSFSLIEAICLAHDLGHSPFGHGGEVALNYLMKDHGGFEANGQTLRIIARLGEYSPECGLDLTRRSALGTIKYPVFYDETQRYASVQPSDSHDLDPALNIDHWAPPKCLYDEDRYILEWILAPFSEADRIKFRSIKRHIDGHHRAIHKAFDTSIMELADDIAYGVHDLEDALALRLIDQQVWLDQVASAVSELNGNPIAREIDFYNKALFSSSDKQRKHAISKLVGYFIGHIYYESSSEFEHPLLRLQAKMESEAFELLHLLKGFVMDEVIFRPELQTLQYKGQQVIIRLFEIFAANPKRLLPREVFQAYSEGDGPSYDGQSRDGQSYRAIADFIAGMTDVSAGKLYHKLLSPTSGSIFDRT